MATLSKVFFSRVNIGSFKSADKRSGDSELFVCSVDTSSDDLAVDDTTEDVDKDDLDASIGSDDSEGFEDTRFLDSATLKHFDYRTIQRAYQDRGSWRAHHLRA